MIRVPNRLCMLIAIFSTAFMFQTTARAEQAPVPMSNPHQFAIQLPDVDRVALIEQVRSLRSQLIQRKQTLVQIVANRKLDSKDAIITVIMPGGLFYAGYKTVRYEQAKNELARVGADIEEYTGDLLAMQSRPASVAVARLP